MKIYIVAALTVLTVNSMITGALLVGLVSVAGIYYTSKLILAEG